MGIALFRCIGALARNEVIASTGGSFFFLILLLVGGFLLAKQNIPDWWIWAYWSVQQPPRLACPTHLRHTDRAAVCYSYPIWHLQLDTMT